MNDDELRAWLALALCIDGRPDNWLRLVDECGGASNAVSADDDELASHGASAAAIELLRTAAMRCERVLATCRRLGIGLAPYRSAAYPVSLATIADPPLVLFWRGAEPSEVSASLAVVGARRCSDYGERTARRIGSEAAGAGILVTSGLARGIDAAAHRGALESGRTLAVLAGGLDRIYPGEHRELAERVIAKGGSLVSEQPPGVPPLPWLFPYRNRIITGLSAALIVVEAGLRSGSLASARHALDQGREVFAVPGRIDSPSCEGSNQLLVNGAAPFCRLSDLCGVAGFADRIGSTTAKLSKNKTISLAGMDPDEASLLTAIISGAATPDELAEATRLDGTRVLALLTALELDGLIRREDHGRFRALVRGV